MAKEKSTAPKKEKVVSGVGALIHSVFSFRGEIPDAAQCKKWASMLMPLMKSDEPDIRVYSIDEINKVVRYLEEKGVDVQPEHLYWSNLVSDIINGKIGRAQSVINEILQTQKEQSVMDRQTAPSGW